MAGLRTQLENKALLQSKILLIALGHFPNTWFYTFQEAEKANKKSSIHAVEMRDKAKESVMNIHFTKDKIEQWQEHSEYLNKEAKAIKWKGE